MASAYLTSMGALWSGWGININAVQPGTDGWVYLAGIDMDSPNAMIVLAYRDGMPIWERRFPNDGFGAFQALTLSEGKVYAAGAIEIDFDPTAFAFDADGDGLIAGAELSIAVPEKAPINETLRALWPDMYYTRSFPVYVRLDGETGSLEYAKVMASPRVQSGETLGFVQVDADGNVYVAGGGWNPGTSLNEPFGGSDAEFFFNTWKFDRSGDLVWTAEGGSIALDPDGIPTRERYQNLIEGLSPTDGSILSSHDSGLVYEPLGKSHYHRSLIFDAEGNRYIVAGVTEWNQAISGHDNQHGVVVKMSSAGRVIWTRHFGSESEFCLPSSMTFDPNGNLVVCGEVEGQLNGLFSAGGQGRLSA